MKFITLEGLDGSGKSTQLHLLKEFFEREGLRYKYLHFPRTSSAPFGELIARFLRGDLGANNEVNPYLVALLYAQDRNEAKSLIQEWLKAGYYVIVDRFVHSNVAFQCAKVRHKDEKNALKKWIYNLEYEHFKLPRPDVSFFLDVPFSFTSNNLKNARQGQDRDYLKGKKDIHEDDLTFQESVREIYLDYINGEERFFLVNCSKPDGEMLAAEMVFSNIREILKQELKI